MGRGRRLGSLGVGVLLARGVVNVLEHSSCEPCWRWRGIEGRLSKKGVGANGKRLSSPTVEALLMIVVDEREAIGRPIFVSGGKVKKGVDERTPGTGTGYMTEEKPNGLEEKVVVMVGL